LINNSTALLKTDASALFSRYMIARVPPVYRARTRDQPVSSKRLKTAQIKTKRLDSELGSRLNLRPPTKRAVMRVTIEHREESTGLVSNRKECFVDCKVEFSEEERAIIKERDLYREGFSVRTSTPLPTKTAFFSTNIMRVIGRFMMMGGFIAGVMGSNYSFLFFVGAGLEIFGWIRARREDKRFENDEQTITIKQLLNNPTFTVHAWSAGYAKGIEEDIRGHLVALKNLIKGSAEVQAKQTFEL
jgi:hypothetical protein